MGKIKRFFKHIEKFFVRRKQQLIMHHLLYRAGGKELIARYTRNYQPVYEPITETSQIWACWWQGENAMPDIVKACYNAMHRFSDGHPVILITEKNYKDYVNMPDYIIRKQQSGEIDLTHFSDILRMMLLAQHGGIWMDSTLLIPVSYTHLTLPTN